MYNSTRAVAEAANEYLRDGDGLDPFRRRVSEGVTADLCEALTQTSVEGVTPLEFNFRWAAARPVPVASSKLVVSRSQLEVIKWAGRQLRQEAVEEDVTVTGLVVRLLRTGPSDAAGRITIAGHDIADSSGQIAHFWVELNAEDYHRAGDAHAEGRDVRITGDLKRTLRRREIMNPRGFEVLAENSER
jgi:hypothetical protein